MKKKSLIPCPQMGVRRRLQVEHKAIQLENLVYHTVFESFFGAHPVVPVDIGKDLVIVLSAAYGD